MRITISTEELIARVEAEANARKAAIAANAGLIDECSALALKLAEAGIEAVAVASVHDKNISAWCLKTV
jgi:hypothetical protein